MNVYIKTSKRWLVLPNGNNVKRNLYWYEWFELGYLLIRDSFKRGYWIIIGGEYAVHW